MYGPLCDHSFYSRGDKGVNAFQQIWRRGGLKNFFWRGAQWERGGQFLEGGEGFLEIRAIINFTSRLLFDSIY